MIERRQFIQTGLAAVGAYLIAPSARAFLPDHGWSGHSPAWSNPGTSNPFLRLPGNQLTIQVDGLPFHPTWLGDTFPQGRIPFHSPESPPRWSQLEEHIDVAIVGGGLSGLATAHSLINRDWALFDLRPRFGGNAIGEVWKKIPYSLGSAYFMVADKGTELDLLYEELGVYDRAQVDDSTGFRFEFAGQLFDDVCANCSPEEIAALKQYRAAVTYYANEHYPDIPWYDEESRDFIRTLDTTNFHAAVESACGGTIPPFLAMALQAYCYSSFGVGWDEISAAAGWNFVAAEEFGRIVMPGGNTGLAELFWKRLSQVPSRNHHRARLRPGCIVTNIKLEGQGVAIAWRDQNGVSHTTGARHVVYAGSKHILEHMMPDLGVIDTEKRDAAQQVHSVAYVVVNVLLKTRVQEPFYDLFALHDADFPMNDEAFEVDRRITDAVNGSFAVASAHPNSDVLTLYFPLPWHTARFTIIQDEGNASYLNYAAIAAPQVKRILEVLDIATNDVVAIRMTRWGHAVPYANSGSYQSDLCEILRRPISERVWFANQDNWLLPAVETCLSEAAWVGQNLPR